MGEPTRKRFEILTVKEPQREGDKAFWIRIGSAWVNKDGVSYSIYLDALPVNGKLQMREPMEKTDRQGDGRDF